MVKNWLYPNIKTQDLSADQKETIASIVGLGTAAIGGAAGGSSYSDVVMGGMIGENAVNNNYLSNKYGMDKLTPAQKEQYERLKDFVPSVDELQEKYIACNSDAQCQKEIRSEVNEMNKEATQKLHDAYKNGEISKEDYWFLTGEFANTMIDGLANSGRDNYSSGWHSDPYDSSGNSLTRASQMSNSYLNLLNTAILIDDLKASGASQSKIDNALEQYNALQGAIAPSLTANGVSTLLDNGISAEALSSGLLAGVMGKVTNGKVNKEKLFKSPELFDEHYIKHGKEFETVFNKNNYTKQDYLNDANFTKNNGIYVPELNGYVKFIGGEGSAKYAFVGLDRKTGDIATFHIKTASELSKSAPSLGIKK